LIAVLIAPPFKGIEELASDARADREELAIELCDQLPVIREAGRLAKGLEASKASENDLTHDSSPFRRVERLREVYGTIAAENANSTQRAPTVPPSTKERDYSHANPPRGGRGL